MATTSLIAKQSSGNLNFRAAQKMIHRLLTHDRIKTALDDGRIGSYKPNDKSETKVIAFTKKELAEKLGISSEELEKLKRPSFYKSMASKISLLLIRLYCATKFAV
jgi:hypothetical protein